MFWILYGWIFVWTDQSRLMEKKISKTILFSVLTDDRVVTKIFVYK